MLGAGTRGPVEGALPGGPVRLQVTGGHPWAPSTAGGRCTWGTCGPVCGSSWVCMRDGHYGARGAACTGKAWAWLVDAGLPHDRVSLCHRVFELCHSVIPPRPYYQGCVFDHCHMTGSDVVCSGLQLYASLCASHGVCVDWRGLTNDTCRACPPGPSVGGGLPGGGGLSPEWKHLVPRGEGGPPGWAARSTSRL